MILSGINYIEVLYDCNRRKNVIRFNNLEVIKINKIDKLVIEFDKDLGCFRIKEFKLKE